jgi:hypothetical protein
LNFRNLFNKNKETIEYSIPNGTLDPDTWVENINMFCGIIAAAQKVDDLLHKKDKTKEEKQYLSNYYKLTNQKMPSEEILECLLNLAIPPEDRNIYRERYQVNSELLKQDTKIDGILRSNTYHGKISFANLKEQLFKGNYRIRGPEYYAVANEIDRQLEAANPEKAH